MNSTLVLNVSQIDTINYYLDEIKGKIKSINGNIKIINAVIDQFWTDEHGTITKIVFKYDQNKTCAMCAMDFYGNIIALT